MIKKYLPITLVSLIITLAPCSNLKAQKDDKEEETKEETPLLLKELSEGEVFSCSTNISYEWEPELNPEENPKNDAKKIDKKQPAKKTFFTTLVERGKDGNKTKMQLEKRLETSKADALTACKSNHSASNCIFSKLKANSSQFHLMDFESKKIFKKGIIDSCNEIAGTCIKAVNSEIHCEIYSSPDAKPKEKEETKSK